MARFIAALLLCCVAGAGAEENLDSSRDAMGRGVRLFQSGHYREAAAAFEKATELTPTNMEAKLYLGVCYMAQFNPASQDPANLEFAHKAETQFMAILEAEPADDTALSYMASLAMERGMGLRDPAEKKQQLERAREWYEQLEDLVPGNKEAPFNLAAIAFQQAHQQWMDARTAAGMGAADPGPVKNPAARAALQANCAPLWKEGVRQLHRALEIDPNFENAMEYMNLILREQADLAASDDEYQRQIAAAEDWGQKAAEARKRKGHGGPGA
ncbi:MAG TPA: tetratricopeptide repeat protein [Bryobacteraceae bacterium]|nr:tetratricopeptide repeat protein [Bryobacteraceae bacterium]